MFPPPFGLWVRHGQFRARSHRIRPDLAISDVADPQSVPAKCELDVARRLAPQPPPRAGCGAQRVDLSDRLGFDLKEKASLPGLFLTAAMARQPDAVILISSNDPARIKSNVSFIDWDAANNRRKGFVRGF